MPRYSLLSASNLKRLFFLLMFDFKNAFKHFENAINKKEVFPFTEKPQGYQKGTDYGTFKLFYRFVNFSTCCSAPLLKRMMYIPFVKWPVLMVAEPAAT